MAVGGDLKEKSNVVYVEVTGEKGANRDEIATLDATVHRFAADTYSDDPSVAFQRIKLSPSHSQDVSLLPEASRNTGGDVVLLALRGSPLRALLVASVGTIGVITFTGLLVFMVFFLAATVNAVVIFLLMSIVAIGCFVAVIFACLAAIYIGTLSTAVFVITIVTISAIISSLIVTGLIGFLFAVWIVTKKSFDLAKISLTIAGSTLSTLSINHLDEDLRQW